MVEVNQGFMLTLQQAAQWLPDSELVGDRTTRIHRVHTDSRTLQAGDLFVALKGPTFDGAQFLAAAHAAGAVAAIVNRDAREALVASGLPGLVVPNTHHALMALAKAWRAQFDLPLIAVTGSNGKTTVTQMIASILAAWHPDAHHATQGNFNNDIGVPLTLLRLRQHHRASVVELGMNHPGEIAVLADAVRPTVALVNNAQREHQEHMHSVEAVARENGSVFGFLTAQGTAVYPFDEEYAVIWKQLAPSTQRIGFADQNPGDASVTLQSAQWQGDAWVVDAKVNGQPLHFALHVAGRHNVKNALAATACTVAAGAPLQAIADGLSAFLPVKGRSRALTTQWGGRAITLIDDTYNANPDSVRAAIDVLAELPQSSLLILGDMGEVGDHGPEFHREVGAHAKAKGITDLWTLGDLAAHSATAFGPQAQHRSDMATLIDALNRHAGQWASVLVKGSRFMRMERAVEAITEAPKGRQEKHNAG